jgi:hypothetical protein
MHLKGESTRGLLGAAALSLLAACGGGGGGGAGSNSAPTATQFSPGPLISGDVTPATTALPANGARAVATYESIGLYWTPPAGSTGCSVLFRKGGETSFRQGVDLWLDPSNRECRGSLVLLEPGTSYEVQIGAAGKAMSAGLVVSTWPETDQLPIAQTITLPAGTRTIPLTITQGGSASGYVVYQADPSSGTTIDVQNVSFNNVTIAAPYVILRGFSLKGAQQDAIKLLNGAHDVVIEKNDISGWGSLRQTGSWDSVHPAGPQGISLNFCGGNNVIRWNEITSADYRHYYNDGIGGSDNYTRTGFPNYDSDIYGNVVQGVMDDAIEAEGGNRNVRIWGNFMTQTATGIASTVNSVGPMYIFRNVYDRSQKRYLTSTDSDDRGEFFKSGSDTSVGNGRRYVFHNTSLQAPNPGGSYPLGAGGGIQGTGSNPLTNTVSRNNIFYIWKSNWMSVDQRGGSGNDVDYDLYNGGLSANSGAESHGLRISAPIFAGGHGVGMSGLYQLAPGVAGYGTAQRIPNFNDAYAAPDIGAHQSGTAAMKFGVNATR